MKAVRSLSRSSGANRWIPSRPLVLAFLVFVAAFSLYGLTTSQSLEGYEPETAAVTEGFVQTGDFVILPQSPMSLRGRADVGTPGKDGKEIGRAGLTDPLVRAPFYAAGWAADEMSSDSASWEWRRRAFWFASPFYVAIGAAFFFLLALELTHSRRWALILAGLFAVGSLAWPYAKIGMEGVLMTAFVMTLCGVLYATRSVRLWPWVLAGFGAGATLANKPYALLPVLAVFALLVPSLRGASSRDRARRLAALGAPLVLWGVGFLLFNWTRTGSALDPGRNDPETTLAAPFNFVGFFISPGKGLIFYSPLVVIGLLGLAAMYRRHRGLTLALVAATLGGVAFVAGLRFWSDETWGPRYIVWVAWLLLLPIPFWAVTRRRRQILASVAALAVAVQFLGVVAPGTTIANAGDDITGYRIFSRPDGTAIKVPYGRDPIRWIPEMSPLLLQAKVVVSRASLAAGGPPVTTAYRPYEGRTRIVRLDQDRLDKYGMGAPYFWWAYGEDLGWIGVIAVAFFLASGLTATVLLVAAERRNPTGLDGWRSGALQHPSVRHHGGEEQRQIRQGEQVQPQGGAAAGMAQQAQGAVDEHGTQ